MVEQHPPVILSLFEINSRNPSSLFSAAAFRGTATAAAAVSKLFIIFSFINFPCFSYAMAKAEALKSEVIVIFSWLKRFLAERKADALLASVE